MHDETEEEFLKSHEARRLTRKKLRDVLDTLQAQRMDLSDIRNSSLYKLILQQVAEMFKNEVGVNVRELKFDALVMKELTDLLKAQALKLENMSKRCDFETFANRLKSNMNRLHHTDRIHWHTIGNYTMSLYSIVPMYTAMLGPIEKEEKRRKVAEKRTKDKEDLRNVVTQKAETIENEDNEDDEATNQRVSHLFKHISKKHEKFNVLDLLIDSQDPVQTVENFFDFSFLIKEKTIAVDVDKNTKTALGVQVDAGKVANNAEKKQMVLSISMRDLMRLKQLEKDQNESNPLHRDDTIYAAKDVREQIQFMEQQKKSKKSRRNEEEEDEDNHEEEEEEEEVIRSASKKKRRAK